MTPRFSPHAVHALQPLVIATTLALAPLLAQAQGPVAPTQLWVDLSTATTTGMPEMAQMGGVAGMVGGLFGAGRNAGAKTYGHASGRFIQQGGTPGLSGAFPPDRVMDLALFNPRKPGTEAALHIPLTMGMGEALPLVPPSPSFKEPGEGAPAEVPDIKGRLLVYWGCGGAVRPGQPKVINLASHPAQWGSVLAGRHAPERAAKVGAQHALYPNEKNTVNPKASTSLVGEHQVRGEGVPESMRFALAEQQDLMAAIRLQTQGALSHSVQLSWLPVPRAHAYHLHAMGAVGPDMVLWSSAENGDAGLGLFDYLTEDTSARWVKERVLLGADTTQCEVPAGIFASPGGEAGGAMLRMMAYGPESQFSHPVRPPKAPAGWQPEWTVRVRTKSQTMALLGLDMAGMAGGAGSVGGAERQVPADPPAGGVLPGAVNILRGLLGR